MKSIFVNNGTRIPEVFGTDTVAALTAEAGLDPHIYSKADILADPTLSADADYLFSTWGMPKFTEDEIARCFPRLKAVFYAAGTVQAFARPFLNRSIRVFSAWAANAVPVAEYTVAQILLANTGYFQACARFSQGAAHHRNAQCHAATFPGNYGCKVGLIGVGMIGSMVAERLKDYRLEVLVHDPFLSDARAEALGVRKVPLEVLFAECQTISNHLANNPQTVGMLNASCFDRMKPNAVFLNTGRGAQVVEDDLCRALTAYPERTAVLDVTFPEPPADGSPLYALPNVFLTPHIAGSKGDEVHRMSEYMLEQFRNITACRPVRWEVTLPMLETMA
ncbi:MAG: hydroxyacid dehydrogenase [Clostridia bacterium]|nr:hydroxyacid dehydrogenase [Clostridia bacterium]